MAVVRAHANASMKSTTAQPDAVIVTGAFGAANPKIVFDNAWTVDHTPMKVLLALYRAREKLIQYLSGRT